MSEVWFDLTTSMQWNSGIVGIIRTELELAANLKQIYPKLKFSELKGNSFYEIPEQDLQWLLSSENVSDSYLKFKKYPINVDNNKAWTELNNLYKEMPSRLARLRHAILLLIDSLPDFTQEIIFFMAKPIYRLLKHMPKFRKKLAAKKPDNLALGEHPYNEGDLIISVGWMDSLKETFFSQVKFKNPKIKISYLIYDLISLNPETNFLYDKANEEKFRRYFHWISQTCDFVFYGGENTRREATSLQKHKNWNVPPHAVLRLGSDPLKKNEIQDENKILKQLGIKDKFIICVGSIDIRKNHDVLYKAYIRLIELGVPNLPQLLFLGKEGCRVADLMDTLKRDPRIQGKIIALSPTDTQMDILYRNCLFTLLASISEGWNLVLPESFSYGKFCLSSNIPSLREIGQDFAEYIDPWDTIEWSERIAYYAHHPDKLLEKENRIKAEWKLCSWLDCAHQILDNFEEIKKSPDTNVNSPTIWYDLTTSYVQYKGSMSGIIRSELMLAKYLYNIYPNISFFAFYKNKFFTIPFGNLAWLFEGKDLNKDYANFHYYWEDVEKKSKISKIPSELRANERAPNFKSALKDASLLNEYKISPIKQALILICSILPMKFQKPFYNSKLFHKNNDDEVEKSENQDSIDDTNLIVLPFKPGDIVFCAGIDWTSLSLKEIYKAKLKTNFKFCHFIYDLTPLKMPHLHSKIAPILYQEFFEWVTKTSDQIFYYGYTAESDGKEIQKDKGWKSPKSTSIILGTDFLKNQDMKDDEIVLKKLGVREKFILAVGTLEIRKNHETLYKAYLQLIKDTTEKPPLMIFAGRQGWKVKDLVHIIKNDERVKDKLLILSVDDQELDVLYRNCLFTVLPSLYEGRSLMLTESLSYGKVCICSDVQPIREVGEDFVEYIHPWDIVGWSEKIDFYLKNPEVVSLREQRIRTDWQAPTWSECSHNILNELLKMSPT